MGRDHQPKSRQAERQARKQDNRASYARILIVSEDSKAAPSYFKEIQAAYQLHSANVEVQPSRLGTAPIQVVEYARDLFEKGDLHKCIRPRSFDRVYAVFDRDDHASYFDALKLAESLDGKLRNDAKQQVSFKAIASVPSFELWLLLHYADIQAPIHRDEVMRRLTQHLSNYEKGMRGSFASTRLLLNMAIQRAEILASKFSAHDAPEPYTAISDLVQLLIRLRLSKRQSDLRK